MGVLAGVGIIAGTLISAAGQRQAGKTNEAIAKHNAQMGRLRAVDSLERGDTLARESKQQFKQLISEQQVGFATQNVQLGVGVSETIRAETEFASELESQRILNNAAMEAWGFEQGAEQSILSGTLAANSARFGSAGTLLSGISAGGAQISSARRAPITTPSRSEIV